ncbi:GmrSD restriction endonuclease domain-containing protein [Nocardiopsis protaetiae]|uniref:GmrSD restriction endonuclease domain-containing protein n=1 Tax=Nocardiopsis protaetiae TaxID=3382270 RepID=UPI00387AA8E1
MVKLSTLLDQIDTGTVLLPEFQRGYVWNRDQVRGLMRSMYLGHPVGSLLMWETSDSELSARGADPGSGPYLMLLDGQQRITSLYGVIKGSAPAFFDGDPKAFTGLYFNVASGDFAFYMPSKMAGDPRWVNVTELFSKGPIHYLAPFAADPDAATEYLERLNRLHQVTVREFHQEKITGSENRIDEVVDIFNRVNSGGTKLSKGDLALARVCAQWPDARRVMRRAIDRWQERGYRFSLDWLLRATTAVAVGRAQFESLNKVTAREFESALERTIAHTDTFLEAVSGRLGLDHDRVLKSRSSLAVAVRLLELNGGRFDDRAHRDRVLYWYMHSALWARYSATTETTLQRDYDTAAQSGVDGLITALERSRNGSLAVRPDDFEGTQGGRFYPLLYVLVRTQGARDLGTGLELNAQALGAGSPLIRRALFSTELLRGHGGRADAIANFCFLTQDGGGAAAHQEPHEYLGAVEAALPGALASQWIPNDPELWRPERYSDFLAARRELLAGAARSFLEELREGTAQEDPADLAPLTVTAERSLDPRAMQIGELVESLREAGYAEPELDTVISDPVTGRVIAEAEAFWPDGLQRGQGKPVVLELDPEQADLPRLQELGYEVFTSADSLRGFVERLGREPFGVPVPEAGEEPHAEEEPEEPVPAGPETVDFGKAMLGLYEKAKQDAGYTASAFLGMLSELGPLGTARRLLHAPAVSDGFANLWERGRLDLTVEALVLRPEFAPLFTEEELGRARGRLEQFGYRFLGE